jgi:endonuclease YncB( thermonuclease family)
MIFEIKEQHGVLTRWYDGDSTGSGKIQFRLVGIDCPEQANPYVTKEQPYAREIANDVRYMFKGKLAQILILGKDKYDRYLAKVIINGIDITQLLLSKGYGWYLTSPIKEDRKEYQKARNYAKSKKLGLWQDEKPIKPSIWRSMYKPLK